MPSILSVYWKLEVRCPESGIRIITSVLIFKWWPVGDFYFVIHTSEFLCRVCICYRKVRIHTHTHTSSYIKRPAREILGIFRHRNSARPVIWKKKIVNSCFYHEFELSPWCKALQGSFWRNSRGGWWWW